MAIFLSALPCKEIAQTGASPSSQHAFKTQDAPAQDPCTDEDRCLCSGLAAAAAPLTDHQDSLSLALPFPGASLARPPNVPRVWRPTNIPRIHSPLTDWSSRAVPVRAGPISDLAMTSMRLSFGGGICNEAGTKNARDTTIQNTSMFGDAGWHPPRTPRCGPIHS